MPRKKTKLKTKCQYLVTRNKKIEELELLSVNNITHDPIMTKSELLHIAKVHKDEQKYVIDVLARAYGHEVLRLPPYHC